MNYFLIMRSFWDFTFANPDKIKPIHIAIFCFLVEHCNRLGWKEKFGLPTMMTIDAIGVKSVATYSKALGELEKMGLIKVIEKSKNQWSANIIAISKFKEANKEANAMALDRAREKHVHEHANGTINSTVSIIRPNTTDNKQKKVSFLSFIFDTTGKTESEYIRNGTSLIQWKVILWHIFESYGYDKKQCEAYYDRIQERNWCNKDGDPYTPKMLSDELAYYHKRGWLKGGADATD
jgi:DNA-binding transcriptional regulator YhcF (GntR family)